MLSSCSLVRKNVMRSAALAGLLFVRSVTAWAAGLDLAPGSSSTVKFEEDIVKVNVSRSGVVEVAPSQDKRSVRITGKKLGSTELTVTKRSGAVESYEISVSNAPVTAQSLIAAALRELVHVPEVRAARQGDRLVLSGTIASRVSGEKLAPILANYRTVIVDNTDKPYRETSTVAEAVNTVLDKNGIRNLRVRTYGKLLVLQGFAKDQNEKILALKIARLIDPIIEDGVEAEEFSAGPSVGIDVMFLEYSGQNERELGLLGQGRVSEAPGVLASGKWVGYAAEAAKGKISWSVAPLTTMLTLLESKGESRVVSNPHLVVRSGYEAKFHSGGKVFLTNKAGKENENVEIFPVDYGMVLGVRPKVDSLGQIDVVLNAEVSEFSANSEGDLPGQTMSKTNTAVTLRDGHSVLLTGFKNTKERKVVSRIPLLADIPLVGEVFKNRRFQNEQRELFVLMTVRKVEVHEDQLRAFDTITTQESSKDVVELDRKSTSAVRFSFFD